MPHLHTIHLVDADEAFLSSFSRQLRLAGFQVAVYPTNRELVSTLDEHARGCVIADFIHGEWEGLGLLAMLQGLENPLPVIFVAKDGDIPTAVAAMRGGAEDFLTRLAPIDELARVVKRAFIRHDRERSDRRQQQALQERFDQLSPRQREVLAQVVQGKPNKVIAGLLGIDVRTVKLHRTAITKKLGVDSTPELTALWIESGVSGPREPAAQVRAGQARQP